MTTKEEKPLVAIYNDAYEAAGKVSAWEAETAACNAVAAAAREREWISVDDRLPESNREVLIRCGYKSSGPWFTGMGIYVAKRSISCNEQEYQGSEDEDDNGDLWWPEGWYNGTPNDETYYRVSPVTHWMPLPNPPKALSAFEWEKQQ